MGLLGSIVGGVFGLLGSKKQKTTSSVDYVSMARNAQKAGFNPLTAIRNGGSAGFTSTTSPSASQLPGALQSIGSCRAEAPRSRHGAGRLSITATETGAVFARYAVSRWDVSGREGHCGEALDERRA